MDWRWILIALSAFWLCTMLPLKIAKLDDEKRKMVYWFILIPVSLVILFYVYPAGIELFRSLAVTQR